MMSISGGTVFEKGKGKSRAIAMFITPRLTLANSVLVGRR